MVYTIIAGNVSAPSVCQSTNWGRLLHLYGGISHFNVWHFPREAARKAPYPISYTVGEKALSGLVSVRRKRGPPPTAPPPIQSCYWEEVFTGCASQHQAGSAPFLLH